MNNMLKSLGQLSRRFHKGNEPFSSIRDDLVSLFEQIDPADKNAQKCLDMVANMATDDIGLAMKVLKFGLQHNLVTEQIYTATIKAYCDAKQADPAIELVREMIKTNVKPHVRTFVPIFSLALGEDQYRLAVGYLDATNPTLTPTAELFGLMLGQVKDRNRLAQLINWAQRTHNYIPVIPQVGSVLFGGSETTINERGICSGCQNRMGVVDLTPGDRENMLGAVFDTDQETAIARWLKTRHYDIVIDGANVAHYNNSPFDLRKVVNMINKINQNWDKKILLVFAGCRKKQTRKLPKWTNVDVFYTRVNTNDDLSWLYAGLYYPDIWVITNDQMRDHVYYKFTEAVGRPVIDLWMERNIVGFQFQIAKVKNRVDVKMGLDIPLDWSVRPQMTDTRVHIPLHDNVWLCSSL